MENKKVMIPVILGVMLLCGIVFTIVYKKTDGNVGKEQPVVQTLAPKETEPIETRISTDNKGVEDFEVNEAKSLDELLGENQVEINTQAESNKEASGSENVDTEKNNTSTESLSDDEIKQIQKQVIEDYSEEKDTEVIGMDSELFNAMQDKYKQELEEELSDEEMMKQMEDNIKALYGGE